MAQPARPAHNQVAKYATAQHPQIALPATQDTSSVDFHATPVLKQAALIAIQPTASHVNPDTISQQELAHSAHPLCQDAANVHLTQFVLSANLCFILIQEIVLFALLPLLDAHSVSTQQPVLLAMEATISMEQTAILAPIFKAASSATEALA